MALQYNSVGRPVVRIGNWAEEAALMDSLGLQCNSQTRDLGRDASTVAPDRIIPRTQYDPQSHFVTMHKAAFRREVHLEHGAVDSQGHPAKIPSTLPRRADLLAEKCKEEAVRIHKEQQEALAKQMAEVEEEKRLKMIASGRGDADAMDPNNPFAHRAPLNRKRDLELGRPPITPNALAVPAITIYSTDKTLTKAHEQQGHNNTIFGKNNSFSSPMNSYTASQWR